MKTPSDVNTLSLAYLEELYADYLEDPQHVPAQWRGYFEQLSQGKGDDGMATAQLRPAFRPPSLFNPGGSAEGVRRTDLIAAVKFQERIDQLVANFRSLGHLNALLDPLGAARPERPELTPGHYGFTAADLDRPLLINPLPHAPVGTARELFARLQNTYCRKIGAEFMHLREPAVRGWLQQRMESSENATTLPREEKVHILARLIDAANFDQFVLKKYIGAKVFSLEGGEILIPLLDLAIEQAAQQGITQIVMGMAHRGRLNVLANILRKSPKRIFCEFEDRHPDLRRGGDVKYHLGHSNDWKARNGRKVRLTLCFNPSHLEFVNPVAEGSLRAKLDRAGDVRHEHGLPILIHGDAAFAGEGIIQETLNLAQLPGYTNGGTLHVIVNNQIGFTTLPHESRSTTYSSDVGKMIEMPIFHVNGEDPEAVAHVLRLALDFRREFSRDVLLDVYCYRRHGHNEGDEPEFTQPVLYREIHKRKSVHDLYARRLQDGGDISADEVHRLKQASLDVLEAEHAEVQKGEITGPTHELGDVWRGYRAGRETVDEKVLTGVPRAGLVYILNRLTQLPQEFHLHPKLERWMERRREMSFGRAPLDWAAAEAVALSSLAIDGYRVRLTGQDVGRGTFSHRHAVLHDHHAGTTYVPLKHVMHDQAPIEIINSPLCEAAALGFEYGFSLDYPDCLVAWEGQFGDFSNVAQVIIDQFITSAEEKWSHLSGITLLLPHGFEGQGPEHSSGRLERFLNLAVEHNIQICSPTTPAQYFHVLRRQMLRRWLKPLVIMSPKSLLRHPRVVSPLEDLVSDRFHRVIPDRETNPDDIRRIVVCSGKIYYDLWQARADQQRGDVAVVRLEQLYPFPAEQLRAALEPYRSGTDMFWVQEEPGNMGAGPFLMNRFRDGFFDRFPVQMISRYPSASPATGSMGIHRQEQQRILAEAFAQG